MSANTGGDDRERLDSRVASSIVKRRFVDEHGEGVRLSDFSGKVLVISNAMRLCLEMPPVNDWMTGKSLTYDIDRADLIFFIDGRGHERSATARSRRT